MKQKTTIVVTSIFSPNTALREIANGCKNNDWDFIIIGDVPSPKDFKLQNARFYSIEEQKEFDFKLSTLCPERHYTRKNLGYLTAIANGSEVIIETDDDNIPSKEFWFNRYLKTQHQKITGEGWCNIYSFFSKANIWPRGLPLESILTSNEFFVSKDSLEWETPIQQGLANQNPDVDAVYRMTNPLPINFENRDYPLLLDKGVWSPFNSQNTTWYKQAFPLLYLPSFCTFRMTDIWRSFVAQRIAWECGWGILYHNSTVEQERNEHNLLRDFEQEVPGYLLNDKIKNVLEGLSLEQGVENIHSNLLTCYEKLISLNFITDKQELDLLNAWLDDLNNMK